MCGEGKPHRSNHRFPTGSSVSSRIGSDGSLRFRRFALTHGRYRKTTIGLAGVCAGAGENQKDNATFVRRRALSRQLSPIFALVSAECFLPIDELFIRCRVA